jgi:hypothetical protein
MKRMPVPIVISWVVLLLSCNSGPGKEEAKAVDTTAAVAAPADVKPVFTPFKVVMIQHPVKNFDKWEVEYFAHDSVRKTYGITDYLIGRDLKDSNLVYVIDKMDDLQKAKTFSTLPELKKRMKKAGVSGPPTFSYAEVVRNDDSPTELTERLMVAHHVKDFDTWLKAFDGEGAAVRTANGLVDRGLARGIVDSNMVYVVFAVSDMAKAKARAASPELKKIMKDAGVDGPPTIRWYRLVK